MKALRTFLLLNTMNLQSDLHCLQLTYLCTIRLSLFFAASLPEFQLSKVHNSSGCPIYVSLVLLREAKDIEGFL